jgi:hypothetical protein
MGTFGKLQSWVLAEDEEALKKIGWQPDHVARGFDENVSTVSAASSTFMGQNIIPSRSDPRILMQLVAYGITYNEDFASGMIDSPRTLLLAPTTAEVLAQGGYARRRSSKPWWRRRESPPMRDLLEGVRVMRQDISCFRHGGRKGS